MVRRIVRVMRGWPFRVFCLVLVLSGVAALVFVQPGFGRQPGARADVVPGGGPYAAQNADWLASKNAFQVLSNVPPFPATGAFTSRLALPRNDTERRTLVPSAYALPTTPTLNQVASVYEPSDGNHPNDGSGTSSADDAGKHYSDVSFFNLCGPGAASIVLAYWPNVPVTKTTNNVKDPAHNVTTSWNSGRYRGYMLYLAWQMQPPGWKNAGMMDTAHYPSWGTTLQSLRDGMNWEASGHNANTWADYYYTITWWGDQGNSTPTQTPQVLHDQIVFDVYSNSVPVIAEVDANLLPNWGGVAQSTTLNHFVTIIGYNDAKGVYYYTDTCGKTTGCGQSSGSDGGIHTVSQSALWKAITAIPVNHSLGDGGWVW